MFIPVTLLRASITNSAPLPTSACAHLLLPRMLLYHASPFLRSVLKRGPDRQNRASSAANIGNTRPRISCKQIGAQREHHSRRNNDRSRSMVRHRNSGSRSAALSEGHTLQWYWKPRNNCHISWCVSDPRQRCLSCAWLPPVHGTSHISYYCGVEIMSR